MKPIWSGALSFGIINVPVKLYSASRDRALDFKLFDKSDLCPVSYLKICRTDGRTISEDEIVKGFEVEKGKFVTLTQEDFRNADLRKTSSIEIMNFTPREKINPAYYDKPYYVVPQKKAGKAYALLREAIRKTGLAGIAQYAMRDKGHIGAVMVSGNALVLIQLRYRNEIRRADTLDFAAGAKYSDRELDVAVTLVKELSEPFDPSKYKDTYTDELMQLIKDKARGKKIAVRGEAPKVQTEELSDIMKMLRRSLEKERAGERRRKKIKQWQ